MPKCELPVKVYIYCTKSFNSLRRFPNDECFGYLKNKFDITTHNRTSTIPTDIWNGKVVAEFTLNKVDCLKSVHYKMCGTNYQYNEVSDEILTKSCLTQEQVLNYTNGNDLYAWHIDDLKIYDKPKELSEFSHIVQYGNWYHNEPLTRPPQSWCYVEELEEV